MIQQIHGRQLVPHSSSVCPIHWKISYSSGTTLVQEHFSRYTLQLYIHILLGKYLRWGTPKERKLTVTKVALLRTTSIALFEENRGVFKALEVFQVWKCKVSWDFRFRVWIFEFYSCFRFLRWDWIRLGILKSRWAK